MLFAEIKARWFAMPRVPLSRRLWLGGEGERAGVGEDVVREVKTKSSFFTALMMKRAISAGSADVLASPRIKLSV